MNSPTGHSNVGALAPCETAHSTKAAAMIADHALVPPRCTVHVNGNAHEIPLGLSLAGLLQQLGHAPAAVATAVDGAFVARDRRASFVLDAGAQVHCFQPIVGG